MVALLSLVYFSDDNFQYQQKMKKGFCFFVCN